ncbi:VOC family protein [Pyxidicoccus fallax]|uniref:VOC family protein n=1 Tax=Pyxidicoccus fallax TaxID=394095 RepID=A0A848LI71_9BACT|nr:VOC family protein [Pyxidicoccus fallax]NMO17414.1 VOC family protein [Pyxidicoccus fallax]NPC77963.1 VOC family protein [Pyxidicoccus fallax]
MKITLNSLLVDDQAKALKFYTEVLGFVKKHDIPMGEFRWLTVASPEQMDEVELVLEPMGHPAARVYQQALFKDGIPLTSFASKDIHQEYEKLSKLGVVFRSKPTQMGPVTTAIFEDTCGNLIQLHQT